MTKMEPIAKASEASALPQSKIAAVQLQPEVGVAPQSARRARFPWFAMLSFLFVVCGPVGAIVWYLEDRAADRYASRAAFSIRSNEEAVPMEVFGAITRLSGSSTATDAQILYDFIQSQQIVRLVAKRIDLEAIFAQQPQDILHSLPAGAPIEDLLEHWHWMVDIALDPGSGLLSIEARAFTAKDAAAIADAILAESIDLVNRLSDGARADLVRATKRELEEAEERLRKIRVELRTFRDYEQEVDPTLNVQATLRLIAGLKEDRSEALVKLEQLTGVLDPGAPQIRALKRRIATIDNRIAEERTRVGTGAPNADGVGRPLSRIVGQYEELLVDREFAEQAYTVALASHQQALVEARRRHRHLAVHISPTLSDEAEYPDKPVLILMAFALFFASWAILNLILGNIAERR